jgi:hypothetical protein
VHKRHPRLAHARPVRHEPKLRQLRRRERRRGGVCPPKLEVFLALLVGMVGMVRERLRVLVLMRVLVRVLVWVWVWVWMLVLV